MRLDYQLRIFESEKKELRDRMRSWMDIKSLKEWGSWKISDPRPMWHIDVRELYPFVPLSQSCDVSLPIRFQIAFQPEEIEAHQGAITSKETPALVWRPGIYSGLSVTEVREWYESQDDQQS